MGLKCTNYFENSKYDTPNIQIITCKGCSSHLCLSDLILSDNFNGASGPAYLVGNLINIEFNLISEETEMKTGIYLINKIKCHQCKNPLGWYYKKSYSYEETYKEGKFVIEKNFIKFVDNHTTTKQLIEIALKNKNRRRSSTLQEEFDSIEDDQNTTTTNTSPTNKNSKLKFFSYQIKKKKTNSDYRQNGLYLTFSDDQSTTSSNSSNSSTGSTTRHTHHSHHHHPPPHRHSATTAIIEDDDDEIYVDA
ncbi:uncharacterized protein J8A68_000442 [[Candida] subhashii]|uniref:Yippee domain-containing protein n=1 Tax=[Candida] subhashii TaxID=561895 RepID=A0A8J5QN14_9ASCO|nr:uncharacterized protein J8A68_000442 [[Candida] subhashii]KAG7666012.1 hypothetical protein J8A68_000442 [[Candida] subhashii]